MLESLSAFWAEYGTLLLEGTRDTLIMVGLSTVFAYLIGLPLGVLPEYHPAPWHLAPQMVQPGAGLDHQLGRSLPFIILMIAIMDFTKLIVGTKMGVPGAIVPLVVSAAPLSPVWWRPPWPRWTPVWWRPPNPWGPPGCRSSGKSICLRQSLPDPGGLHLHHHHLGLHRHRRRGGSRRSGRLGHPLRLSAAGSRDDVGDRDLHHRLGPDHPIPVQLAVHQVGQASEINSFILFLRRNPSHEEASCTGHGADPVPGPGRLRRHPR